MGERDVDAVLTLYRGNPLFFRHCPPPATRESVLRDMTALPPRKTPADKFYYGFLDTTGLAAVIDLILRYPDDSTAFIGLFMVAAERQGQGLGSALVQECFRALRERGFRFVRLAYAKGNPQSAAFWAKNGFAPVGLEVNEGNYTAVVLQRELNPVL